MKTSSRHIIHLDMDAFFAAVEQLDRPDLCGKPVLVGGDPKGRGVVSTASYEARPFGCHSAMPMAEAIRLCPHAIIVRPRMSRYSEVSHQLLATLEEFTPLVEPLSIDEAFLDITGSTRLLGPPERLAREIKRRVRERTELTASVGLAPNKFLAKLASDLDKPDGLVVVDPDRIQEFLDPLPISRLWGVGKATLPKLEALGLGTFGDLRRVPRPELRERFGEAGDHFHQLVRGIDDREVICEREAKSISHEVTFPVDVTDREHLRSVLLDLTDQVARRLRRHHYLASTIAIKVRTGDFSTFTRRTTLDAPTDETDTIWQSVSALFSKWDSQPAARGRPVRLIGAGVAQFVTGEGRQLDLFGESKTPGRRLDHAVDEIRDRFGNDAISRGGRPERKRAE